MHGKSNRSQFVESWETGQWLERRLRLWNGEPLQIVSPSITRAGLNKVAQHITGGPDTRITILNNLDPLAIALGSLGARAIADFVEGSTAMVSVYNSRDLHAKIFLFETKAALVGSANLTESGLCRNLELGYHTKSKAELHHLSGRICSWLDGLVELSPGELREFHDKASLEFCHLRERLSEYESRLASFPSTSDGWSDYFNQIIKILRRFEKGITVEAARKTLKNKFSNRVEKNAPNQRLWFLRDLGLVQIQARQVTTTEQCKALVNRPDRSTLAEELKQRYPILEAVCQTVNSSPEALNSKRLEALVCVGPFENEADECKTAKRWAVNLELIAVAKGSKQRIIEVSKVHDKCVNKARR